MNKCKNCGSKINKEWKVCPNCGADLKADLKEIVNEVDNTICPECGGKMEGGKCPNCGYIMKNNKHNKLKNIIIIVVAAIIAAAIITTVFFVLKNAKTQKIEIDYQEKYEIKDKDILKYNDIVWDIDDESIVEIDDNTIIGVEPGKTTVNVKRKNGKLLKKYNVVVNLVPIKQIILSTNSLELMDGDTAHVEYSLMPEGASDYGVSWSSADENVATIDEDGNITAQSVGQTTIILSEPSGQMATLTVTVQQKPAYERLSDDEKLFVDAVLNNINYFKSPDSVHINSVEIVSTIYYVVNLSAQNSFGATTASYYYLYDGIGFFDYMDYGLGTPVDCGFDIDLINEAIQEKR